MYTNRPPSYPLLIGDTCTAMSEAIGNVTPYNFL